MDHVQTFLIHPGPTECHTYLTARQQTLDAGDAGIRRLTEIMLNGPERQSWRAARLLNTFPDRRVIPAFLRALESPYPLTRQAAVSALADFRDCSVVPALLERLPEETEMIQLLIVDCLGKLDDARAVASLQALLAETRSSPIQLGIIDAFGRLGDTTVASLLPAFFESEDPHVRKRSRAVYQQLTAASREEP